VLLFFLSHILAVSYTRTMLECEEFLNIARYIQDRCEVLHRYIHTCILEKSNHLKISCIWKYHGYYRSNEDCCYTHARLYDD